MTINLFKDWGKEIFEPPECENAKIWRYMDLTKFLSILDKEALFFQV